MIWFCLLIKSIICLIWLNEYLHKLRGLKTKFIPLYLISPQHYLRMTEFKSHKISCTCLLTKHSDWVNSKGINYSFPKNGRFHWVQFWIVLQYYNSTTQKMCTMGPFDLWDRSAKKGAFTHLWKIQPQFLDPMVFLVPRDLSLDKAIEIIPAFGQSGQTSLWNKIICNVSMF